MKITNAKQLSNRMQDIRLSQGLSQEKIAKQIGLRQGTVSNFEKNPETTKLETFFKLLSVLELEIELKPRRPTKAEDSQGGWEHEW
ncbi:helix-turn-helix domain-containing protein [Thorsellia anophelis]|uniref:HTH-type transcriptional regulator / antitoxin HipB n=1 Tax=Thorsellia anophelis DSM 18579 TaxID=1123402 RepID=A0A1I0AT96_9GAMM|nr:helix-turn-helix domain-containing protein [Thorsellia anophelis]SES97621.1 HTH-type transcriptional regulator / antitoxin HipB [Thorsellia anophelis DSM 18579]